MEENVMIRAAQCEIDPRDPGAAAQAAAFVEAWLEQMDVPMKTAHKLMIAVDEICSNIIRYSGASRAQIRCTMDEGGVALRFSDDGAAYNPLEAAAPDVTADAQEREIGGLGIFVVRRMMDDVAYLYEDGMNILTIRKA